MGNYATLTALPNGATRVRLRRSTKASPGSHAFLWLPAVRFAETHPFTLVSSDPAEFVVHARDGFTSAIHQYAKNFPGETLRCSLNAGYGKLPDFKSYDSVLLIAGGSGASFTFAVALDLSRNPGPCPSGSIIFVWVVRNQGNPTSCDQILITLTDNVQLRFHGSTRSSVNSFSTHVSRL
jgi:NAD(P)H-flavin reductase